jgi:class 3 adenylate cyclase/tetratricopeptide (TPR) repeat protein
MGHIFISHSERDLPVANEIIRGLESSGYSTWYFERDMVPGTSYITQIAQAIEQSQAVVLVVSSNALDSDQVSKEVVGAFERRKPFFPVLVDLTPPQLKERQPEWRHALGSTTMICLSTEGIQSCAARIIEGLNVMGIKPETVGIGIRPSRRPAPTPANYTPKHLADKILAARASLEGERKQVTVLFADVKGFTSISEKLDPEEVNDLISECMVFLTEEIHRYEGTIAQFLGDGLLALFGAPIAHEDAPQRALYAALGMRDHLREYGQKLKQRGIEFNMRIGLNTGLVVVGKIGDDLTMEYTAMGDTVNLASRMESTAEPGTIQVSENTYRLTEGYFDFQPLGEIELKGKKEPVKAYRLLGLGRVKTRLGVSEMRGLTPFVGRRTELEHLLRCYEQAKRGQGQVVGITGEPGVGKSRLLLQLRSVLPQGEYSYLEGECHHYGDTVAYLPILDILRAYCGIEEGEQEALSRKRLKQRISQLDERLIGMLLPLQELLSLKVEDEQYLRLDPQLKRARIFEAIWSLLIRESQNQPLVLAVEDLQWVDKTSEEFLGYIIARLGGARIMLIILYRPEYTPIWVSKTYYSQIRVDELPLDASAEMVQAILKEGKAAQDLIRLILDRAAGNPLFMEEFTRSLLERGYIERKNGHYVLTVKATDIQVPETVQGIISARMDRLEKVLKETMQVASVIGREFAYRILQVLTGMQDELRAYVFSLQELEFIYEKSLFPELEYMFKHNLTQEVAYNSLLLKRRREIHERTGKAIEELYKDRLEEFYEVLAYHYSAAESWEKAYQYMTLSGNKVFSSYSTWEAYRFYKEATVVISRMPDTEQNKIRGIEARLNILTPMALLGSPQGSLDILHQGENLSRELGDERSLARFHGSIGLCHAQTGDAYQAVQYLEQALESAERIQDVELMVPIAAAFCVCNGWFGDYLKTVNIAPRFISLLESRQMESASLNIGLNVNNAYVIIVADYGCALAGLGKFEEGLAQCEKGIQVASSLNDLAAMAYAEMHYGNSLILRGDADRAVPHIENAIQYSEKVEMTSVLGASWVILGLAYSYLGDFETAKTYVEKGIRIHIEAGITGALSLYYNILSGVHLGLGELNKAQSYAEKALALAQERHERNWEGLSLMLLGAILGMSDVSQYDAARQRILQGMAILDEMKVRTSYTMGYLYLGMISAVTGRTDEAAIHLRKARDEFQDMGMDHWLRRTQEELARLQG